MHAMQRPAGYPQQKTQEPAAGSARPGTSVQRRWLAGGWEAPGKRLQMKAFPREGETLAVPPGCAMAQSIFVTALPETWRGSRLT